MTFLYIMTALLGLLMIFIWSFMVYIWRQTHKDKSKNLKSLASYRRDQWVISFDERLSKLEEQLKALRELIVE